MALGFIFLWTMVQGRFLQCSNWPRGLLTEGSKSFWRLLGIQRRATMLAEAKARVAERRSSRVRTGIFQVWVGPPGQDCFALEVCNKTLVGEVGLLIADRYGLPLDPPLRLFSSSKTLEDDRPLEDYCLADQSRLGVLPGPVGGAGSSNFGCGVEGCNHKDGGLTTKAGIIKHLQAHHTARVATTMARLHGLSLCTRCDTLCTRSQLNQHRTVCAVPSLNGSIRRRT